MTDDATQAILAALTRLENGQAELKTDVAGLKTDVAGLKTDVAGLKTGLAKLEERVTRLEAGQTQLRTDLMDRLDRQQDTLTGMRDDILVTMGRAESAHKANENTRDEVRALHEIVFSMGRQINNLQAAVRELQGKP